LLAEPALLARVPDDFLGERPVPAEHAREPDLRQARMAPAVIEEQPAKATSFEIPAGEGLGVRPGGLAGKTPGELFHRLLGELSIGGDLAANTERTGAPFGLSSGVEQQVVIARHRRWIFAPVVVERAHARIAPHHHAGVMGFLE